MDEEWLAAANEAVDRFEDQIKVGEELARGSKSLAGTGRPLLNGLLELPQPYCEPFRQMVAHPAVEHRLNWMGGSGGRMGGATGFVSVKGTSGHSLHDANEPLNPGRGYVYHNGRSYCEAVTVAWQLRDVRAGDGGFACVPGSHKAYYKLPPGVRTCDRDMGLVKHVEMQAGDVLFFGDGGTTHGALAWKSEIARRGILIKYSSRNFKPQWRRDGPPGKPLGRAGRGDERHPVGGDARPGPRCVPQQCAAIGRGQWRGKRVVRARVVALQQGSTDRTVATTRKVNPHLSTLGRNHAPTHPNPCHGPASRSRSTRLAATCGYLFHWSRATLSAASLASPFSPTGFPWAPSFRGPGPASARWPLNPSLTRPTVRSALS